MCCGAEPIAHQELEILDLYGRLSVIAKGKHRGVSE